MESDERERFLYQEFVRHKHAVRIRAWVTGKTREELGITDAVAAEIGKLLEPLGMQFRRDLGLVCESHHLSDLGDTKKYKVSQPYGNSDAETVNLQYGAVLLRTADLLHITSDRTPSIEFRTINPSDPLSQDEWAKQIAVKRVRPAVYINEEGLVDESRTSDTIEVYAYFSKEDGFFGLTSYLTYASDQLKKSHEWISTTLKSRTAKHEFPWRKIDDNNIETEGFIRDAFEFTIDQAKILDLLTGHTLYNDTRVVLRELLQNAIDAIRIKHYPNPSRGKGQVHVSWDSKTRTLSVRDNGTGMTQEIINNFFLKVGSSRYQDPDFKKQYPGFSSISRFGIGVLSAFMIADSLEITTCHEEEEQARRLTLRSVHGKYLIRLVDKSSEIVRNIAPHGTVFQLRVRPSVKMPDVLESARRWAVIPECDVYATIDKSEVTKIGFSSPSDALREFLRISDFDFFEETDDERTRGHSELGIHRIRIVERRKGGLDLAYALKWNAYFKEWLFLSITEIYRSEKYRKLEEDKEDIPFLGTCVEGIRIVPGTPGFNGVSVVALANVKGPSAPRTNVARSGLEATPERETMLRTIYELYAKHVIEEMGELISKRAFSATWAAGETPYLISPLLGYGSRNTSPINSSSLLDALQDIPCVMVEQDGKMAARTPREISKEAVFWVIDSGLMRSAELLLSSSFPKKLHYK